MWATTIACVAAAAGSRHGVAGAILGFIFVWWLGLVAISIFTGEAFKQRTPWWFWLIGLAAIIISLLIQ